MKEKLFNVLSGTTPLSDFEQWLYHDDEIQSSVLTDETILELVSIDFSGRHALHELQVYCLKVFDQEEFYVHVIEQNVKAIVDSGDKLEVVRCCQNVSDLFHWMDNKNLYHMFYRLFDDYSYSIKYADNSAKNEIIEEMKALAADIVEKFKLADLAEKKRLVDCGLERGVFAPQFKNSSMRKRWYQFWK